MFNEWLLVGHIFTVILFSLGALRLGKEALISWIALQGVLANLFVVKQIDLFGLHVTCSDVYVVGSVFGLNLLQEFFGQSASKKSIFATFLGMLFMSIMSKFHVTYSPSVLDWSHSSYSTILEFMPRLLVASVTVFFLIQLFDVRFFAFLKSRFPRMPLTLRNSASMITSQGLDTLLFTFLGLYGVISSPWHVICVSFSIKLIVIVLVTPFSLFAKRAVGEHVSL